MDAQSLEIKWQKISKPSPMSYNLIHIDSNCFPELKIGFNDLGNRCLFLGPLSYNPNYIGEIKENITTFYNIEHSSIILELTDNYYHSIFLDLVISLFFKIKDIKNEKDSTSLFILTIKMWSSFLENEKREKLSEDIIKGIFGELTFLKYLLKDSDYTNVNHFLNSWKGPFDANNDFYFDDKNVEVKTKNSSKKDVNISSEFQLELEHGKSLELLIVTLDKVMLNGTTLEEIINQIRERVICLNGDLTLLYQALKQKSLTPGVLSEYNSLRFILVSHQYYNCSVIGFPRIVKSELPNTISGVKYRINLDDLDLFLLKSINF
jgi:hypothetical protein